jgi:hypothetical protein
LVDIGLGGYRLRWQHLPRRRHVLTDVNAFVASGQTATREDRAGLGDDDPAAVEVDLMDVGDNCRLDALRLLALQAHHVVDPNPREEEIYQKNQEKKGGNCRAPRVI